MLVYSVAWEVVRNKSIKVSGITYGEEWTAEEDIGIFAFDEIVYKDLEYGEFLAIKKPGKSQIWKSYRYREDIVKVVYLNPVLDDGIWIWLLTEDWSKNRIQSLKEAEMQEVLDRFRKRMREYDKEFFGGERVADYIWQQLLYFEVVERMNAPNALIISSEPIRRYFKPLPIIIDIS
jgi:hypothetical protein